MADGLTAEQADLLRRIEQHAFDPPGATQSFESRLASENGWTSGFARRVIGEYQRFVFLFAATERPVAPPDLVDQVWHLHLLYTQNYWDTFCKTVLGRPLHHEPAAGVDGERGRLADWYADTIERYRQFFGDPPVDIWPTPQHLATTPKPRHQRVDMAGSVVVSRRMVLAAAAVVMAMVIVIVVLLAALAR